jgi:hypothetical protein
MVPHLLTQIHDSSPGTNKNLPFEIIIVEPINLLCPDLKNSVLIRVMGFDANLILDGEGIFDESMGSPMSKGVS